MEVLYNVKLISAVFNCLQTKNNCFFGIILLTLNPLKLRLDRLVKPV